MTTVVRTLLYILFHMPIWKQSRVTGCSVISALDTKRQLEQAHSQVLELPLKTCPMQFVAEKNKCEHIVEIFQFGCRTHY